MTLVSDTLPKTSEPLPLIAYFLMVDLIISALINLYTIINLRLYHKDDNIPNPKWLNHVYHVLSCNCRQNVVIGAYDRDVPFTEGKKTTDIENVFQTMNKGVSELNKVKVADASSAQDSHRKLVSWQDISIMLDYILLVIFTIVTVLSFVIFMLIKQFQSS